MAMKSVEERERGAVEEAPSHFDLGVQLEALRVPRGWRGEAALRLEAAVRGGPAEREAVPGALEEPAHVLEARRERERWVMEGAPEEALLAALGRGDFDGVQEALGRGASPDARLAPGGESALSLAVRVAARTGDRRPFELLLDQGADVDAASRFGETPLHEAAYCGDVQSVGALLRRGADPMRRDAAGRTPAHMAKLTISRSVGVGDRVALVLLGAMRSRGATAQQIDEIVAGHPRLRGVEVARATGRSVDAERVREQSSGVERD